MNKFKLFAICFLAVLLIGCSSGGTVTKKDMYSIINNVCEDYVVILICEPEPSGYGFMLWIKNYGIENAFDVNKEIYDGCEVGDMYYSNGCIK